MKKKGEESYMDSQIKQSGSGEFYGAPQPSVESQRLIADEALAVKETFKDDYDQALAYVNAVKETFKDRKEKYEEFLEVLNDYRAQRINIVDAIARVKEVLKGYHTLLLGFKTFVPKGCEFALPLEEEAIHYVNKIKMTQKYHEFIEEIKDFKEQRINKVNAISPMKELLKGHPDLLLGFNTFFPKGFEFTLPFEKEAINYVNKIKIL